MKILGTFFLYYILNILELTLLVLAMFYGYSENLIGIVIGINYATSSITVLLLLLFLLFLGLSQSLGKEFNIAVNKALEDTKKKKHYWLTLLYGRLTHIGTLSLIGYSGSIFNFTVLLFMYIVILMLTYTINNTATEEYKG